MSSQDPTPDPQPGDSSDSSSSPAGQSAPGPAAKASSFDASSVARSDWIILGLGLALLICSFLPWYTVSVEVFGFDGGSYSSSGWDGWWTLIQLLVLAVVAAKAYEVFTHNALPVPPIALPAAGAAIVVLTIIALVQTLLDDNGTEGLSSGPGFGLFLAIPVSLALAYFLALDAQNKGAVLPVKLPGASA